MEHKLEENSITIKQCIANTFYCGKCLTSL